MISAVKKSKKSFDNVFCDADYSLRLNPLRYAIKICETSRSRAFRFAKNVNAKHCVTALILLTLGTIIYYTHYVESPPFVG